MHLQRGFVPPCYVTLCCFLQPYLLKLPPCLQAMSSRPGTAIRHYFRVGAILRRHLPLLLASYPLLSELPRPTRLFFWRLFTASSWGPPHEMPRSALSPENDRPGASPLLRCRGSTADSLCRLCGQSQGSGSAGLTPFSCAPHRIPTRS